MKILPRTVALGPALILAICMSCATHPAAPPKDVLNADLPAPTETPPDNEGALPELLAELPPEALAEAPPEGAVEESTPELPLELEIPEYIEGSGKIDAALLASFLLQTNLNGDPLFIEELAILYAEEAALEGINHDIAFAQMCLETGYLNFGGLVTLDMNNFCGLGAISASQSGERFPNPQMGVRAHIQHLKAYATTEPPEQELVDPRYRWVRYGSAPTIHGLAGTWAADTLYAEKIRSILERIYRYSSETLALGKG